MTSEQIQELMTFKWYHRIEIEPGVFTKSMYVGESETSENNAYLGTWKTIEDEIGKVDFSGKSVLDVGCRDGKFSFLAESLGASSLLSIDNCLSEGGKKLAELKGSKIQFKLGNVLDRINGEFDVILFLGVLYHLRDPFLAIRNLSLATKPGGKILVESGFHYDETVTIPILFCPVEDSPYEPTSCSFFNEIGFIKTMRSYGFERTGGCGMYGWETGGDPRTKTIRGLFEFTKTGPSLFEDYWHLTHKLH